MTGLRRREKKIRTLPSERQPFSRGQKKNKHIGINVDKVVHLIGRRRRRMFLQVDVDYMNARNRQRSFVMDDEWSMEDRLREVAIGFVTLVTAALFAFLLAFTAVHAFSGRNYKKRNLVPDWSHLRGQPRQSQNETNLRPSVDNTVVCTVGHTATYRRWYPVDSICTYIVYKHVFYDTNSASFLPSVNSDMAWTSFRVFLRQSRYLRLTSCLPSLEWQALLRLPEKLKQTYEHVAKRMKQTLSAKGLYGLAMLEVRAPVEQLPEISSALKGLRSGVPDLFLVLGISFVGVTDGNLPRALPTGVLDTLMTPLSMFILETHSQPYPGRPCRTAYSSAQNNYGNPEQNFTLKGAVRLLSHPAVLYVDPKATLRCISLSAAALVFKVYPHSQVCREPNVREDVDARATYGYTNETFFTYETNKDMSEKYGGTLQWLLDSERPACLAIYHIDMDDIHMSCARFSDRIRKLPYSARDLVANLRR
ncbi:uncharacterized protein LOC135396882 isoform X2 [Ornithodoros turicata]|uniref:uncharacterized protein LOC135396882 isoform X2 n=1 Tax=Ornithodoros turicata TaxID=34597 RepID=UPI003138F601